MKTADCVGGEGDCNAGGAGTDVSAGDGDTVHMDYHSRLR